MTTKHTPGPWQTDAGGEVHKDGRTIFAWPELSGAPDEEIHANMALGSAAPDLLAVARKMRSALNDAFAAGIEEREGGSARRQGKLQEKIEQFMAECKAAIAKAEGGE